eukprot:CAMPEP_0184696566 /NCGR_PEP_ID=MMETSP0313-20130426/3811_1 /TAXON_ID=2792 /ORGANISM="Porphyridium aerugineum, Strain SAG 1380-2" /LENGTH=436 /DNA_ID=CAMNT_0027155209 /DNA_START=412 /DNA_END=1722 /DNA_ORIENTATION=-
MDPPISDMAMDALSQPMPNFIRAFFEARTDLYSPTHNPRGVITLSVAEDVYATELTSEQINQDIIHTDDGKLTGFDLEYSYSSGREDIRKASAKYLEEHVFKRQDVLDDAHRANLGNPENVIISAGAGACIDLLTSCLVNPGEGVCIPTPYYRGFENDVFRCRGKLVRVFSTRESEFNLTEDALDAAVEEAKKQGIVCKVLLFSSPDNPKGTVYTPEQLSNYISWARKHKMHTIVDEIYAYSVYDDKAHFVSIARVLGNNLGNDVHIVYGFGKDLGICGLRIGCIYTENHKVRRAAASIGIVCQASNQTQKAVARLLSNEAWFAELQIKRRANLKRCSGLVCAALDEMNINYIKPSAGYFIMIDLSPWMISCDDQGEEELWNRLFRVAKLNMTPGRMSQHPECGWFRFVFAASKVEALEEAMRRLKKFLIDKVPPV